ncbi:hypothetical protein H920_14766 [Fukomys damarensis]|uniref:Uncharacterized protein n=1 Tax=Fukomys damarensis TaxID=885580 RepID=A0A091D014_FUKDA|nr:hypothetical protein H920_14766 [Fukomys damarensis]
MEGSQCSSTGSEAKESKTGHCMLEIQRIQEKAQGEDPEAHRRGVPHGNKVKQNRNLFEINFLCHWRILELHVV